MTQEQTVRDSETRSMLVTGKSITTKLWSPITLAHSSHQFDRHYSSAAYGASSETTQLQEVPTMVPIEESWV